MGKSKVTYIYVLSSQADVGCFAACGYLFELNNLWASLLSAKGDCNQQREVT